jgi:23S rRNA (uridine2552-2'-O)-methyltransferase
MKKNTWVDDHYTERARKEWYLARSIYKLEEIDQKYHIVDPKTTKTVLDIGCAPWSRLQYVLKKLPASHRQVIGIDLKEVALEAPWLVLLQGDASDQGAIKAFLATQHIAQFDLILSDMAPDTIWTADIDAVRSIGLIEKTLWLYEQILSPTGKFAIKVFMGPWFDELIAHCKKTFGASSIVVYKPKACRKQSKETYIIRR